MPLDYIKRLRHKKGFGVQSPFAFNLVQFVIGEELPYYAYSQLEAARSLYSKERGQRRHPLCPQRNYRLLFRLANFCQPQNAIEAGGGASLLGALAISLAKPSSPTLLIGDATGAPQSVAQLFEHNPLNRVVPCGEETGTPFESQLAQLPAIGLLHLCGGQECQPLLQAALRHTDAQSLVVVEGIGRNGPLRQAWQSAVADERVILSFDMVDTGLLFFDPAYVKQHYELMY